MRCDKRPEYLFVSSSEPGTLYDTRKPDWNHGRPLREKFAYTAREIPSGVAGTLAVRAALRNGGHAWPGGYALYFVAADGESLSFQSVRENLGRVLWAVFHGVSDGWRVVGIDSMELADGESVICAHSGKPIE